MFGRVHSCIHLKGSGPSLSPFIRVKFFPKAIYLAAVELAHLFASESGARSRSVHEGSSFCKSSARARAGSGECSLRVSSNHAPQNKLHEHLLDALPKVCTKVLSCPKKLRMCPASAWPNPRPPVVGRGGLHFCFGIHSGQVVIGTVGKKCPRCAVVPELST